MDIFSDDEYDLISNPGGSKSDADLDSSMDLNTALAHIPKQLVFEPPPTGLAIDTFGDAITWSAADIQSYARKALASKGGHTLGDEKTLRIYIDGIFDQFGA